MEHTEIVGHLADLEKHPGWKLVVAEYEKGLNQIVKQVLDQSVDDTTTLKIKHAHGLVEEANPEKLRLRLQGQHRTKALAEAQAAIAAATDGESP